jgi:hypothetical protein
MNLSIGVSNLVPVAERKKLCEGASHKIKDLANEFLRRGTDQALTQLTQERDAVARRVEDDTEIVSSRNPSSEGLKP